MQEHEAELAEKDLEKYGVDIPVEAADSEEEIAE
jgi:hypothetical protein